MKKNRKFYRVCNPTAKNQYTGNLCVNYNEVCRQDKDFIYSDDEGDIILDRRWVLNHIKPMYGWTENNDGTRSKYRFFVLEETDIFSYEAA